MSRKSILESFAKSLRFQIQSYDFSCIQFIESEFILISMAMKELWHFAPSVFRCMTNAASVTECRNMHFKRDGFPRSRHSTTWLVWLGAVGYQSTKDIIKDDSTPSKSNSNQARRWECSDSNQICYETFEI